jgi:hypothetical protein
VKRMIMLLAVAVVMAALMAGSALSAAARPYSNEPPFDCIKAPCEEEPGPSGEAKLALIMPILAVN